MSMVICTRCDWNIDSDYDCDCFIGDECFCESCREEMVAEGELVENDNGEFVRAPDVLAGGVR